MGPKVIARRVGVMVILASSCATGDATEAHQGNFGRHGYHPIVPAMYAAVATFCDVPPKLLYAVALGESGRRVKGRWIAWPWTLNIEGEGHYFASREKAFEALMTAISHGRSVDVGPMQLNWYWKYAFLRSPWLVTDPWFNIGTACRIIRDHYDANPHAGWFAAAGRYHREANRPQDVAARKRYVTRIRNAWRSIR